MSHRVTPDLLLKAYAAGIFPMAENHTDPNLFWVSPEQRGILPLEDFHIPKRLKRTVRADTFRVTTDVCFADVMRACAAPAPGRTETWINDEILRLYTDLHEMGFAHSIECWQDGKLAGGLYGVALRGAFFGESMFHHITDASKVALVHLVARLKAGGFVLLDTQFITTHLAQFGTIEIPREAYLQALDHALECRGQWPVRSQWPESSSDFGVPGAEVSGALPSGSSPMSPSVASCGETVTSVFGSSVWSGALALHFTTQTS